MKTYKNKLGQAIGYPVGNWRPTARPTHKPLVGRFCYLEPLDINRHSADLYAAFSKDTDHHNWTYLPYGPFNGFAKFEAWLKEVGNGEDPFFYAIVNAKTKQAVGLASYLRINPADGVIEVGHIHYSPLIQRSSIATEAMFLMMRQVFDELGYRRYEWKCDALNAPSRKAALRLGFRFEGIFRQLTMYKGRNRDTAWYAIIDKEWPSIRSAYQSWLDPKNFDRTGNQQISLGKFIEASQT